MAGTRKSDKGAASLEEEIELLRRALREAFRISQEAEDAEDKLRALGALGAAAVRLANMVKVQRELERGKEAEVNERIKAAIEEAAREMGLQL